MVYTFKAKGAEGKADMKNLLGGKGANLAEMCNLGIPVPPGFTISTDVCSYYYENNNKLPEELKEQVLDALKNIEKEMGRKFGDPKNPLLLSVRSGARRSMPGMMDTVLNLGINDEIAESMAKLNKNNRLAWDSYRRFVQMYGDVVLGLRPVARTDSDPFEEIIEHKKYQRGIQSDIELNTSDLKDLVTDFKKAIQLRTGNVFPQDPMEQLWGAIRAVFESWNNDRAKKYRALNGIPDEWGTAVNVQTMVYGNMGNDSATGVAFTRNPSTGENHFYGEYLLNAQGEDVVAGVRTPQSINRFGKKNEQDVTLEVRMPEAYDQLMQIREKLEQHYKDMQDIEFTIEKGKLWMLQTRNGKRTAAAALRIAVEMVDDGMIDEKEALKRIQPEQLDQLLHPSFDPKAQKEQIATGLPASPGAATGRVVFHADDAEEWTEKGEKVILVRIETSPEDIGGMNAAQGILTARGGMTSHAAVVARGMGKCCVAGCSAIHISYHDKLFKVGDHLIKEGDYISLDGTTGEVYLGSIATIAPQISGNFKKLMSWADKIRKMSVRTNADSGKDARLAREFGAEGIGLCRTEHMFFEEDRIDAVREMIMAEDKAGRQEALDKILPMQIKDFMEIFEAMDGYPVTIRSLDPPLHEFLPNRHELFEELVSLKMKLKNLNDLKEIDKVLSRIRKLEKIREKVENMTEFNPMLGLRGCRLGIMYPELTAMQARAIFEAACQCKRHGIDAKPEIMVPLITSVAELDNQKDVIRKTAQEVMDKHVMDVPYLIGTMIELPSAAIRAREIAKSAEFFSFGTNDLTQTTLGLSRDDSGKFLPEYVKKGIFEADPFQVLDQKGVGELVKTAVEAGRKTNKKIKLGICGEHGGDPKSVTFFGEVGLDYVSCSPYRVPIARLAAAQAQL
ncbi:MAG TPA: pyruvate, phosphate dikinase [Cytophagales bacterium]|nr:pyruvate, phosphate dikinase [Cytophagales bacterium]